MKHTKTIIGIVGPTGSGKTTLAKGLAKRLKGKVHLELPSENPYLPAFYQELQAGGESKTALKSQLHFLLASQRQAQAIATDSHQTVVWDVPLYGHKMYADLLYTAGSMSEHDYRMYEQVYNLCLQAIPKPSMLLIVNTDIDTLLARIHHRGREMELETPRDYWQQQINYWNETEFIAGIPTFRLNSARINWTSSEGVEQTWQLVTQVSAI